MRYRNPKKDSDLFSMIEHQQSVLKTVKSINNLNAVMDWELFREELESVLGYDNRDPKRGGRPPFDAVLMLKVLGFISKPKRRIQRLPGNAPKVLIPRRE